MQPLIAFDQLLNTLVWAEGEGFGTADETISARCWRLREKNWRWSLARKTVDALFFWQENHCKSAYESELKRRHLPPEYMTCNGNCTSL